MAVAEVNDQVGIVEQNLEELGLKGQFKVFKESILSVFNPMIEAKCVEIVVFQDQVLKDLIRFLEQMEE